MICQHGKSLLVKRKKRDLNMLYQARLIQRMFEKASPASPSEDTEIPQKDAISVYQNNYIESAIRALSITYPSVRKTLEESDFRALAKAYIKKHPKHCFDWADYGESFSAFMFDVEQLAELPFLPELAELDWRLMHIERAKNRTFDAASFGLLQSHAMDSLYFVAAPGLQLMQAIFPLTELYQLAHYDTDKFSTQEDLEQSLVEKQSTLHKINNLLQDAIKSPVYRSIVLWRGEYKGLFECCDSASLKAFESVLRNKSVAQVLSHFGEDQNAMTNWLQTHIKSRKIYALAQINGPAQ